MNAEISKLKNVAKFVFLLLFQMANFISRNLTRLAINDIISLHNIPFSETVT